MVKSIKNNWVAGLPLIGCTTANGFGFGIFVRCECWINSEWMIADLNRAGITEPDRVERDKCSLFYNHVKLC